MPRIRITGMLPHAEEGQQVGATPTINGPVTTTTLAPASTMPTWTSGMVNEFKAWKQNKKNNALPIVQQKSPVGAQITQQASMPGQVNNNLGNTSAMNQFQWSSGQPSIPGFQGEKRNISYGNGSKSTMGSFGNPNNQSTLYNVDQNASAPQTPSAAMSPGMSDQMKKDAHDQYMRRVNSDLRMGVNLLDTGLDYARKKEQQNYTNNLISANSLYDNMLGVTPQNTSGLRGNWDKNNGQFRQNEQGWKNEGMYNQYSAYGGVIHNDMSKKYKIRITGGPDDQPSMAYGGQMGYGLDLNGKRIYTDMPEFKSDNVSDTLQPVDRSEANIEAEKGETLWGDVDGDGSFEHMKIGGKRHVDGGTPLDAPEGSFIFSDTPKMKIKDAKVLAKFGLAPRKEGWTPAEIAKRYDVNKYKAILEDTTSDDIRKTTAQIMIKNFTKKLSELALIQEQMKGFPQGIPDVAKKANPELQTKQDQQVQPGLSDNPDAQQQQQQQAPPQPGGPEPNGVQEYPQGQEPNQSSQQPTMAYGGLIQDIGDDIYRYNDDSIPKAAAGAFLPNNQYARYLNNNNVVSSGNVSGTPQQATPAVQSSAQPVAPAVTPQTTDAQGNIIYGQTFTPKTQGDLNDPEYQEFLGLMKKLDTGKYKAKGAIYINNFKDDSDKDRLAYLATKFGFKRDAQGNIAGHRVIQGATQGYNFSDGSKQIGFYGGYTPEMYEKKVIEGLMGKDASDKMTDVQRRRTFFKHIGINDSKMSDAQLANPHSVYTKDFFKNTFYPAYSKAFGKGDYRPEMGDDMLVGAEHYDNLKVKPPEVVPTTTSTPEPVPTTTYPPPGTVITTTHSDQPFDYMTPDKVNFSAAVAGRPNKYLPWASRIPFQGSGVVFEDWRAKAAERQGMMNRTANQLNTYSPGSATAANLSFLNAQSGEGLIGDIASTEGRNVATANQHMALEGQRRDQNTLTNYQQQQNLYNGNAIANQQYDNAMNAYNTNLAKSFGNAWNNRMKLGLTNAVNPYYQVSPYTGQSNWTGNAKGVEQLGSSSGSSSGTDWASVGKEYAAAKAAHPQLANMTFEQFQKERGKTTVTDSDNNGVPNSVRRSGYSYGTGYGPAQFAGMYNFNAPQQSMN